MKENLLTSTNADHVLVKDNTYKIQFVDEYGDMTVNDGTFDKNVWVLQSYLQKMEPVDQVLTFLFFINIFNSNSEKLKIKKNLI